jgi:hypothetical protein
VSTEIPAYRVAQRDGDIEIREYPALVAAEVSVGGERDTAVREGFRLLAGYIFGGNDGGRRIAMTAPVMQQPQPGTRIPPRGRRWRCGLGAGNFGDLSPLFPPMRLSPRRTHRSEIVTRGWCGRV